MTEARLKSISDVMEFMLSSAVPDLPAEALAEVFDRLIWCLADNGKELLETRDTWLQSDDRRKGSIALSMDETFPLDGGPVMRTCLEALAKRWPEFTAKCENLILAAERKRGA